MIVKNKRRRVQALPGRGPGLNIDFRPLGAQVLSGILIVLRMSQKAFFVFLWYIFLDYLRGMRIIGACLLRFAN